VKRRRYDDPLLATVAVTVAAQAIMCRVPASQRQTTRDEFVAIAMGILHGCCGPNGDFTASYRPTAVIRA
jgi:hypothetical protein